MKWLGFAVVDGEGVDIVEEGVYPFDDRTPVVRAVCVVDCGPYAILSVAIEGAAEQLKPGEYVIKAWSENEPTARAVLEAGIFVDTGKRIRSGFVEAQIWRLA